MAAAAKLGTVRQPSALTPELRDWVDRVIVPALVDQWLEQEKQKTLAEASKEVAECQRQRLSAEGVLQ
jgi:hypothetical protein